ncbi:hypothetical protein KPH14_009869 [Odynerus spinipes]|uniref:Alcohol dehydrogenase n=1 Tax=Odynerus spinipes TaxID=1348599 RepID=A0AAD9RXA6_9HYME|nr:hypothetical protein KPH14_009869 [Odynerus spinipes]
MDIKGRVALVTGAASGIGKTFAIELLNQGAKVSICDISIEGEKLVEDLVTKYGKDRVIFSQCDVTDYPQFEASFQTTIAAFGQIDIVINNAGIMNDRFWELEVDINLNGVIRGTLLAQRFMGTDKGGQGGIVVNIGSNVSINPYVSVPIYSATKAAIVSLTRAFGDQYHVDLTSVKVMALCPSATDSNLLADVGKQLLSPRYQDAWARDTASSVPQKVEHVAKALIHILNTGKSGSVWMVENGEPPREVIFPNRAYSLKNSLRAYPSSRAALNLIYLQSIQKMDNIKNKSVLITGAATGLGYKYAEDLLRKGAKSVAILDLASSNGAESAATLEKEFGKGRAIFVPCDVSKAAEFEEAVKKVIDAFNGIDIFINNAGILDDTRWEKTIDINVTGLIRGSLLALDHMGKHKGGKGGTLVNIASIVGLGNAFTPTPVYTSSKHAVIGFSRTLKDSERKTGVRVLVMCPGATTTTLVTEIDKKSFDFIDKECIEECAKKHPKQSLENVSRAMIDLIQKGKNGAIWVSEGEQPPYHVEIPHYSKLAVPI